ncbi:MAG: rRNA pseudouridine synthase [Proteobacteria bacterium]|nr:rRNA pseudouridine synthase [Pseudomonadota bacterium]
MSNTHDSINPSDAESGTSALVRINKALSMAGVCSRRAADDLVAQGLVAVNDVIVTSAGTKVDPALDCVTVQGEPVVLSAPGEGQLHYVLINKPTQVVTTVSDPQGRRTVMDVLPARLQKHRLFPVGRLDFFSQGLLLLTNDGELANRLTHPRWHLPKVYHVTIRGEVSEAKLETMRQGMVLAEGETLAPMGVDIVNRQAGTVKLGITLIQGLNRQIRRMCRDLGLTVLRLERVAQGPIDLGDLREGQVRVLVPEEINTLLRAVGLEPKKRQAPRTGERPAKG